MSASVSITCSQSVLEENLTAGKLFYLNILVQNRVGITFPPWKSVWETEEVPGGGVTVMEGSLRSAWLRLRLIIQLDCGQHSPGGGVALCTLAVQSDNVVSNGYRCRLQTLHSAVSQI